MDLANIAATAGSEAERLADGVRATTRPYDAFDVVANLFFANMPRDADTYKETEHRGLMAIIEYGAQLCLERESREGSGDRQTPMDGRTVDSWNDDIRRILHLSVMHQTGQDVSGGGALAQLRQAVGSRELFVRNPSYEHQEWATLDALFSAEPVAADLRAAVGFDLADARRIDAALSEIPQSAIAGIGVDARQAFEELSDAVRERRRQGRARASDTASPLDWLAGMPRRVADRRLRNLAIVRSWVAAGDRMQFTAASLASTTSIPQERVEAFLGFFSVGFGQPPAPAIATPMGTLRDRPIMSDGKGNYLCISVANLFFALRPRLTESLRVYADASNRPRIWERFNKRRKTYVENASVNLLATALRPDQQHTNLRFRLEGRIYEIDGLLLLDDIAVVIEAKAGLLTRPAREGRPLRLREDLRKLVVEADDQLQRVRRLLDTQEELNLLDSDGGKVAIPGARIRRLFLVVVTLEDLSWVAPTLWDLVHSRILKESQHPPLVLNLHDLEIISDLANPPVQLVHYFMRRAAMNREEMVRAGDELDLFMYFLKHGLYFKHVRDEPEPPDVIWLQSFTDDLDAYYMWKFGPRSRPAHKPAQKMHPEFSRVLNALDQLRPDGFVDGSLILLNLGGDAREKVAQGIRQLKRQAQRDGELHDMTVGSDGPPIQGITLMAAPPSKEATLRQRFVTYCVAKKYQLHADEWLGLAFVVGAKGTVQGFHMNVDSWAADPELEELVGNLGLTAPLAKSVAEAKKQARERESES